MIQITNTRDKTNDHLIFGSISLAINQLQTNGYSDYEISLVRFIRL